MATVTLSTDELEQIAERVHLLLTSRQQAAEPEPWLTTEQAAAHLGISTSQLYTLCSQSHRNHIPVIKEGTRSYFKASELDAWRVSR